MQVLECSVIPKEADAAEVVFDLQKDDRERRTNVLEKGLDIEQIFALS